MNDPVSAEQPVRILLETAEGAMLAEVYPDRAPITAANFLQYVDAGYFENISFYRVIRPDNDARNEHIRVIQGGLGVQDDARRLPPISHEPTNLTGLYHIDGALSFGRWEPGTASSEFFIVLGDSPQLDFDGAVSGDGQGYAAFGRIISGMDVAHRINGGETGTTSDIDFMKDQGLLVPVRLRVKRA